MLKMEKKQFPMDFVQEVRRLYPDNSILSSALDEDTAENRAIVHEWVRGISSEEMERLQMVSHSEFREELERAKERFDLYYHWMILRGRA